MGKHLQEANLKTINEQSLIGEGNVTVVGSLSDLNVPQGQFVVGDSSNKGTTRVIRPSDIGLSSGEVPLALSATQWGKYNALEFPLPNSLVVRTTTSSIKAGTAVESDDLVPFGQLQTFVSDALIPGYGLTKDGTGKIQLGRDEIVESIPTKVIDVALDSSFVIGKVNSQVGLKLDNSSTVPIASLTNGLGNIEVEADSIILNHLSTTNFVQFNGLTGVMGYGGNVISQLTDFSFVPKKYVVDNFLSTSLKGTPNGLAELGADGLVKPSQLPGGLEEILTFPTLNDFPTTGASGKIYIAEDTSLAYVWTGSGYANISSSLALGETDSTAYRGDRGKIAYDHSLITGNPHNTTIADIPSLQLELNLKANANGSNASGNWPISIEGQSSGLYNPSNPIPNPLKWNGTVDTDINYVIAEHGNGFTYRYSNTSVGNFVRSGASGTWPISINGSSKQWNNNDFTLGENVTPTYFVTGLGGANWGYSTLSQIKSQLGIATNGETLQTVTDRGYVTSNAIISTNIIRGNQLNINTNTETYGDLAWLRNGGLVWDMYIAPITGSGDNNLVLGAYDPNTNSPIGSVFGIDYTTQQLTFSKAPKSILDAVNSEDLARYGQVLSQVSNRAYTTGANATGTWPISISGTANNSALLSGYAVGEGLLTTANTIAKRDANGYLHANYIRLPETIVTPTASAVKYLSGFNVTEDGYLYSFTNSATADFVKSGASGIWPINITGDAGTWNGAARHSTVISTGYNIEGVYAKLPNSLNTYPIDAMGLREFLGSPANGETWQSVLNRGSTAVGNAILKSPADGGDNALALYSTYTGGGFLLQGYHSDEVTPKNLLTQIAGGNFGIGTTNPTEKLQVTGTIKGEGYVTHNNNGSWSSYIAVGNELRWYSNEISAGDRMTLNTSGDLNVTGIMSATGGNSTQWNEAYNNIISFVDDRSIHPNDIAPHQLRHGFTSLSNNESNPYADFLHFGGYQDGSGGKQNLIMFRKTDMGMRQYQAPSQSSSPYTDFVDYWHTGNLSVDITPTPSTVVKRDVNGYVEANYIKTPVSATSIRNDNSIQSLYGNAGSDGYHYSWNASAVRNFIGATSSIVSDVVVQRDGSAQINVPATPALGSHAASKAYVDSKVSGGSITNQYFVAVPPNLTMIEKIMPIADTSFYFKLVYNSSTVKIYMCRDFADNTGLYFGYSGQIVSNTIDTMPIVTNVGTSGFEILEDEIYTIGFDGYNNWTLMGVVGESYTTSITPQANFTLKVAELTEMSVQGGWRFDVTSGSI